jgi:hypothetical protein
VQKVIQDIWILNDAGAVLFNRVFDKKVDEQLIGALISALNLLAEELEKGGLSNFELKEKKVQEEMKHIVDKFFKLYPKEIFDNWDNDVSIFSDFENHIKDSLQDTIDKFEKAFW